MNSLNISSLKKVLFLGPHPDDIEFSSGATVTKFIEAGIEVHFAVFSMCEKSVPANLPADTIKKELLKSVAYFGIPSERLHIFGYEVRIFPSLRQEILEDLVALNKKIQPDLVFLPCSSDIHQDHQTIHNEGVRAFKNNMVLGYEMPWNNFNFASHLFVVQDEEHIKKKIEVLKIYQSQSFRFYRNEEYVRSLATVRGIQIQTKYAEAFEVIRLKLQ